MRTRRGALTRCPLCRVQSRVAEVPAPESDLAVGTRVEARWGLRWLPGVVDEVLSDGEYEIVWENGDANPIPREHVRVPR